MRAALITVAIVLGTTIVPAGAAAQAGDPFAPLGDAGLSSLITAVPFNTYAPDTVPVVRSLGLQFVNLDTARHDVVALEDTRPDGSAAWCDDYESEDDPDAEECPLFWSPLIPGEGSQTPVLGLEDTEAGQSYAFYCTIHPYMVGRIEVVR